MIPGGSLGFAAVPDVTNEAPTISSATWTVLEVGGGEVLGTPPGQFATYTAPQTLGNYHLKATSNFGDSWYVPQPATINVVAPSTVSTQVSPNTVTFTKGYTGPFPQVRATVTPITNDKVIWSIVEPGFEGPNLVWLDIAPVDPNRVVIVLDGYGIDHVPGTVFHVKAQSVEVPGASATVECRIQR